MAFCPLLCSAQDQNALQQRKAQERTQGTDSCPFSSLSLFPQFCISEVPELAGSSGLSLGT